MLHDSCFAIENNLKVDIDILRNDEPCRKRFDLLIPWSERDDHLVVSAQLIHDTPIPIGKRLTKLLDACKAAEKEGRSVFQARIQQDPETSITRSRAPPIYFNVSTSSSLLRQGDYDMFSLDRRLKDMTHAERITLAYRVVETGLLLFRTSWLSSINSRALHRLKIAGQGPR